ncbi:MAG: gliding motility-associated C-terminal domain-containing protein [Saprospiraceae bacterium]|nr:gliding motility-associated C-terminal domain-containing protein [Saprospiraceae bacterium]
MCNGSWLEFAGQNPISFFTPDLNVYGYKYLLTRQDTIVAVMDIPDLSGSMPGSYQLCGISYLITDSAKLPIPGTLYSIYREDLITNKLGICAELSKNCMGIDIFPNYTDPIYKVLLCRGDSVLLNGIKFESTGVYPVLYQSVHHCDSLITLDLEMVDLKIIARPTDNIDCASPIVSLNLSSSVVTSNTRINWSTPNGQIIDSTDLLNIKVNQEGIYKVILSDGNCIDSAEFVVVKNGKIPELEVLTDTITCKNTSVQLLARTDATTPVFKWSNGISDLGNDSTILVSNAGQYYVTVTDINGCSNYTVVNVYTDTVKAILELSANHITCKDSFSILHFRSNLRGTVKFWSHDNTPIGVNDSIKVQQAGWYLLNFESNNGCVSIDSFEVVSDIAVPDYYVEVDTLNCWNNKMFSLKDRSNSILDSIIYKGPGNFESRALNPVISSPGRYMVSLLDTAGCRLDTFFEVNADTIPPFFTLFADTLDCMHDSIQLGVSILNDSTGFSYTWTGPIGFSRFEKQPYAKELGVYILNIQALNGCITTDSIQIVQDSSKPEIITGVSGALNCEQKVVQLFGSSTSIVSYKWLGPGNYESILQNPVVGTEGLYKLIVTAANGCTSEQSISVVKDTILPINGIYFDTINCLKDSFLLEFINNSGVDSISWTGPTGFFKNSQQVYIQNGGNYNLFVRGLNHCIDSAKIDVPYDTMRPNFILSADTLTCSKRQGSLRVFAADSTSFYHCLFPNGDTVNGTNFNVVQSGFYFITATGRNGCKQTDSIFVPEFINAPIVQSLTDSITCADTLAQIGIQSIEPDLKYSWRGPGSFISTDSAVIVSIPGWYIYTVTNNNGCQTLDSIFVNEINNDYQIQYSNAVFNCLNFMNARLTARKIDSLVNFAWTLPNGNSIQDSVVFAIAAGNYIFIGTDAYGCRVRDTIQVILDTLKPLISRLHLDTLNCLRNISFPVLSSNAQNPNVRWIGPKSDTSFMLSPGFSESGLYQLRIIDSNFCFLDTSVFLAIDTLRPSIKAVGDTITCEFSRAQLDILTTDTLSSIVWTGPGNSTFIEKSPQVIDTGWYFVQVFGMNGCTATDSSYVGLDNFPPDLTVVDGFIPCDQDSIQIIANSRDSTVLFNWFGPNLFYSNLKAPTVKDTGYYEIIVIAKNKCATKDTIHVAYKRDLPELQVNSENLTCKQVSAGLNVIGDTTGVQFLWTGPGLTDSINLNLRVNIPGNYLLRMRNQYGCTKDTLVTVLIDTTRPYAGITILDSILCEKTDAKLVANNTLPGEQIQWMSSTGVISGPNNEDTLVVGSAGDYSLILTNPINGCTDSSGVVIAKIIPDLGPLHLRIRHPSCFGYSDGELHFNPLSGTLDPYVYQLNNSAFTSDTAYMNLQAGNYSLSVRSRYACRFDTSFQLVEPSPILLNAGNDTTVRIGASFNLVPSTNANINNLSKIDWIPSIYLNCDTCLRVTVAPQNSILYKLEIADENGCMAVDEIQINVIIDPNLFLPNVFSPNGDQINDFLVMQAGSELERVKYLRIFDRWGNMVFEKLDFLPDRQTLLWDGTFNGEKLNPGVFIYTLEAVLVNGNSFKKHGDISLLR